MENEPTLKIGMEVDWVRLRTLVYAGTQSHLAPKSGTELIVLLQSAIADALKTPEMRQEILKHQYQYVVIDLSSVQKMEVVHELLQRMTLLPVYATDGRAMNIQNKPSSQPGFIKGVVRIPRGGTAGTIEVGYDHPFEWSNEEK